MAASDNRLKVGIWKEGSSCMVTCKQFEEVFFPSKVLQIVNAGEEVK